MNAEKPYNNEYVFTSKGGQQIVDGKSYYPTLLSVNLDVSEMWHIALNILSHLREGETSILCFSGTLSETQED